MGEILPAGSAAGSVVLDIGGDVGAAIISVPAVLAGTEIEIRRPGTPWDGRHVAVLPRSVEGGTVHAAVFPSLEEGSWEVRWRGVTGAPVVPFGVEGGRVSAVSMECT